MATPLRIAAASPKADRMTRLLPALPLADCPEGQGRPVTLDGVEVLLCHDQGQVFAIENRCSHLDLPLTSGHIRYGAIACPMHGARFDLETGQALCRPATEPVRTFPVTIIDGVIHVAC
jgi:3-phenylpropionate/trans-cinnamate dioxygenase ferredoxin component